MRPLLHFVVATLAGALVALPAAADKAWILSSDRDALEARVEAALSARSEILASYFIIGDDPFSLTSLALLRDAARRGVHVQLLVDAQWNRMPRRVETHLREEGIEIREYHPLRFDKLGWIFRRMHDKILIVDGRQLIVGGRNIESTYFGFGRQIHSRNYIDCDLRIEGEAAADARRYFERLWASREVHTVHPKVSPVEVAQAARELDHHQQALDGQIAAARLDPARAPEIPYEVGRVRFVHDPIDGKKPHRGVAHELLQLLDCAKVSAVIESPYLIPSRAFRRGLTRAVRRGVAVRILTNSLASSDNLFAQAGYVGKKKEIVASGVELWEYQGPECLHAKVAVIDGETMIVGTFNLDPRSEFLNSEVALQAQDKNLASVLTSIMDRHLLNAVRIDSRGWPEGAREPFPGIPRKTLFWLSLLRLLAPFIERQL